MLQSPCMDACTTTNHQQFHFLGLRRHYRLLHSLSSRSTLTLPLTGNFYSCVSPGLNNFLIDRRPVSYKLQRRSAGRGNGERLKLKGKDNVWSVDNETAKANEDAEKRKRGTTRRTRQRGKGKRMKNFVTRREDDNVMVSGSTLMEIETVLQTQEPVIRPVWNTFVSSVSGIWKGIGAVFSPMTAEMEPIDIGNRNENLFECYTLSYVKVLPSHSTGQNSQIQREINWVTLNPYGESRQLIGSRDQNKEKTVSGDVNLLKGASGASRNDPVLPKFESFDFQKSDLMEKDVMSTEPGLVFFEDGSYSRGPIEIPVEADESKYYLSPTFKFEQCLVKGCHVRLRVVHTIEFSNGGSNIQIMRVAVYEEQWVSPSNLVDQSTGVMTISNSDMELDLKPFSRRKRVQPLELAGSWKVFEMSATPIFGEDLLLEETNGSPFVYLCTETLKKRNLPENPVYFGEEETLDMQDSTVLWLPGGVTSYVDVDKDGILCIGIGWYSDEGINLVMERDYGVDGKLKDVRWKSEVKRRWSDPVSP